jgi:hypothetical protein
MTDKKYKFVDNDNWAGTAEKTRLDKLFDKQRLEGWKVVRSLGDPIFGPPAWTITSPTGTKFQCYTLDELEIKVNEGV